MQSNMGTVDRIIRLVLATIIVLLFFSEKISGTFGIVLMALAIIFILTSVIGFCPLYTLFGFSSCSKKK